MSVKLHKIVAREKRRILQQLENAVRPNNSGPVISASNIHYEAAEKTRGIAHGGIGAVQALLKKLRLAPQINSALRLLKCHCPYLESDHVLNIAYNVLCGGRTLDDIELRRNDRVFLQAIGAESIPDPTTAGDFCRRFDEAAIMALQSVFNAIRVELWRTQSAQFTRNTARIDADGTMVSTYGDCKQGMDISYNGTWGYHPLVVSFANTGEPLFIKNRSGNRPSHEGVIPLFDAAIALVRQAGFTDVLLRGDSDFSLTTEFDRWDEAGVRFVFGYDARANLVDIADEHPDAVYQDLVKRAESRFDVVQRARPEDVKDAIVRARGFPTLRTTGEQLIDFEYRPTAARKTYRVVALRKSIDTTKGQDVLFSEYRYFFYITNDLNLTKQQVVQEARDRCNQENLHSQLKTGLHALHAPVNTLDANWAYMVMASLAWSIKAWMALMTPVCPRWKERHQAEKDEMLKMEFRTFLDRFIHIPAQILSAGRRIIYRFLAWNTWQQTFFRLVESL